MPTYIIKNTTSDLSPLDQNYEMSAGTGTDTSFNVAPANGGGIINVGFITLSTKPNSDTWENGGTWTLEVEIDTADAGIRGRARVVRLNSTGTPQDTGSYTGYQSFDVSRTFSPVAPTFTGEVCSDRIMVQLEVENTNPHGSHSIDIGVGTTANEVVTDITENAGSCAVAGVNLLTLLGVG